MSIMFVVDEEFTCTQPTVVRELVAVGEPSYPNTAGRSPIPDHNAAGVRSSGACR